MTPALAFLAALLVANASATGSTAESPPQSQIGCGAELVAMSACLPYVEGPPNHAIASPSNPCCETFSAVALDGAGGGAACLCHLVRDPHILGFPLKASRLASLFSYCDGSDDAAAVAASSFLDICQGPAELPPLRFSPRAADAAEQSGPPAANEGDDTLTIECPPPCLAVNASAPADPTTRQPLPVPSAAGPAPDCCGGRCKFLAGATLYFLLCNLWSARPIGSYQVLQDL